MSRTRDPLSVRYDGVVYDLMIRAGRASRQKAGVQAWIASPRAEFRHRDPGGRTAHERAFTRAAYWLIFKNAGQGGHSGWSLKLTWGEDEDRRASSAGRLARPVRVRLYPRGQARVSGPSWVDDPSQRNIASGGGG